MRTLRLVRHFEIAIVLLVAAATLFVIARIVLWRQPADRERLVEKARYLQRIASNPPNEARPNFVVILFDDLGLGDVGAYGSRSIRTPHLDRLAASGALFANGYSSSPYCSASRAGLLTGRYAVRSGLDHVLQAPWTWQDVLLRLGWRNRWLPDEELTIAEILRAVGYSTAIFGKWHLGDESPSLPTERGFHSFFGLHHSNDQGEPAVWRGLEIVENHPIDQSTLTRRYTEEAVAFIESARRPFFLYLPHTFPHVPLHAPEERLGRSDGGLYGDVVEELDASVGAVLDALERAGLAESTFVLATSDNGPWFQGSPGGRRGRKMDVFEGGQRVPLLASWPGRIEPGRVIEEPVMGIDLLPTVLEWAGLPQPSDRVLDGSSLARLLTDGEPLVRESLYFFQIGELRAVRSGRFKYHDRLRVPFGNPMNFLWAPTSRRGPWLFDLATGPDESYDVSGRHPETAARLRGLLEGMRAELSDNPEGWLN